MLTELRIENLGVIDSTEVEFAPGLNVLTGETGAGKTMVVTSLQLVTGARADSSRIRRTDDGNDPLEARIEGRFDYTSLSDDVRIQVSTTLEECGGQLDDDGSVIAARSIRVDGRSRAYLGGRAVPASTLTDFATPLLSLHGQHDQIRLLQPGQQIAALDRFGGASFAQHFEDYRVLWGKWVAVVNTLRERRQRGREWERELVELQAALAEIADIAPEPAEDHHLQSEIRRLMDADELRDAASGALVRCTGDTSFLTTEGAEQFVGDDASTQLGHARVVLDQVSDAQLHNWAQQLDDALSIINDVAANLHDYLNDLDVEPAVLEQKLERQAVIKMLVRKYGADVDDVRQWAERAQERVDELTSTSYNLETLEQEVESLGRELEKSAQELSRLRRENARLLQRQVSEILHTLAMPHAQFHVKVVQRAAQENDRLALGDVHYGENGTDSVQFLLSTSGRGEPQAISKAASGGELSRVMLAVEVVLAQGDSGRTIVFDEVDSGIGGSTALAVGECLAQLAQRHQVLAVTHLPQVAAFADEHLRVVKTQGECDAVTEVEHLDDNGRVTELARMLAGLAETDTGKAHAQELLSNARKTKKQQRQEH